MPSNPLRNDPEGQAQLAGFLLQCYDALNTYGKTPEQLENYTGILFIALGDYECKLIKAALVEHIKRSPNLPTVSDIINIIDPPKPELSKALYVQIMKECTTGGKFLYGEKRDFVEVYEAQEMAKMRGGSEDFREAVREIERHQQLEALEHYND